MKPIIEYISEITFTELADCGLSRKDVESRVKRLEDKIRANYGGRDNYVHSVDLASRNRQVLFEFNEELRLSGDVSASRDIVCAHHGIKRSTFYNIVHRRYAPQNLP